MSVSNDHRSWTPAQWRRYRRKWLDLPSKPARHLYWRKWALRRFALALLGLVAVLCALAVLA